MPTFDELLDKFAGPSEATAVAEPPAEDLHFENRLSRWSSWEPNYADLPKLDQNLNKMSRPAQQLVAEASARQRMEGQNGFYRNFLPAYDAIPATLESFAARAANAVLPEGVSPFSRDAADYYNHYMAEQERLASEGDKQNAVVPAWVSKAGRGVAKTLPLTAVAGRAGKVGAVAMGAAMEGNQALTEGKDAGLSGGSLGAYALTQAGIEAAIPYIPGLGGVEERLGAGAPAVKKGIVAGLLDLAKLGWSEVRQENLVELGHAITNRLSGVDSQALDPERLSQLAKETTAQAILGAAATDVGQRGMAAAEKAATDFQRGQRLSGLRQQRSDQQTASVFNDAAWQTGDVAKSTVEQLVKSGKTVEQVRDFANNPTSANFESFGLGSRKERTMPSVAARKAFGANANAYLDSRPLGSSEAKPVQPEAAAPAEEPVDAEFETVQQVPRLEGPPDAQQREVVQPVTPEPQGAEEVPQRSRQTPPVEQPAPVAEPPQSAPPVEPEPELPPEFANAGDDELAGVLKSLGVKLPKGATRADMAREINKHLGPLLGRQNEPAPDKPQQPAEQPEQRQGQQLDASPILEVPLDRITLSDDVPNFKKGANEAGVVEGEALQGKYERIPANPIVLWERADGRLEVITGRHRLDLAKRTGEKTIPSQIVREADGFTKEQAFLLDAESNIRDEKGSIDDFATYFRHSPVTEEEARSRGLLSRAAQRQAFGLGKHAADNLYGAWKNGKLSADKAAAIASAAPGDDGLQTAALSRAKNLSADELASLVRQMAAASGQRKQTQGDLFGFDDSAIQEMEAMSKAAGKIKDALKDRILAVAGAIRRPEQAKAMGLQGDMASIQAEVDKLRSDLGRWDKWETDPELAAQVREQINGDKSPQGEFFASEPSQQVQEAEAKLDSLPAFAGLPLDLDGLGRLAARFKAAGARWLRKFATTKGLLPQSVFNEKWKADGTIGEQMQGVQFAVNDLKDAVATASKASGKPMSAAGLKMMNAALQGDAQAMAALPQNVQQAIAPLRNHIDALSRRMIANGLAAGKLGLTLDKNLGVYATRSFQIFDDPKWKRKVPPAVRKDAFRFIQAQMMSMPAFPGATFHDFALDAANKGIIPRFPAGHPQAGQPDSSGESMSSLVAKLTAYTPTDQQVNNAIDDLLTVENVPEALVRLRRLGSKDLSIFKKRKRLPPEIRALLGEYTDPYVNYSRSVFKMTNAIANHEFLTAAKQAGMGKFFFDQTDANRPEGFNAKIAAVGNPSMKPLDGLMTHPDIKEAFDQMYSKEPAVWWLSPYMKVLTAAKVSKTVLYELVQLRNFMGSMEMAMANGHFNAKKFADAFSAIKQDVRTELPGWVRRGVAADTQWRDYLQKMVRLRVVDGSVSGGELRDNLRDAMLQSPEFVGQTWLQKGMKLAEKAYQSSDNFWKVYGFENERSRLKAAYEKAGQPLTDEQLDSRAAQIVTDVYPTYGKIPEGIKRLRRFPLAGSFVSFPAEYIRTKVKSFQLAGEELNNPITRKIGASRLAANIATLALPGAITAFARLILGMTKQEDEDRRRFVAPWRQYSDLLYTDSGPNGEASYIDLSHLFPSAYLRKPLNAIIAGEASYESLKAGAWEFLQPYLGEDMVTQRIFDIKRNQKPLGGQVYNPQESDATKALKIAKHVAEPLEPGTITQARRMIKAVTGTKEESGHTYDVEQEALNFATGLKAETVDIKRAYGFKAYNYDRSRQEATRIFNSAINSRGTVSKENIDRAYQEMESAKRSLFDEMHKDSAAAIRLGVPEHEVFKTLSDSGISKTDARNLIDGTYVPFSISKRTAEEVSQQPDGPKRMEAWWKIVEDRAKVSSR